MKTPREWRLPGHPSVMISRGSSEPGRTVPFEFLLPLPGFHAKGNYPPCLQVILPETSPHAPPSLALSPTLIAPFGEGNHPISTICGTPGALIGHPHRRLRPQAPAPQASSHLTCIIYLTSLTHLHVFTLFLRRVTRLVRPAVPAQPAPRSTSVRASDKKPSPPAARREAHDLGGMSVLCISFTSRWLRLLLRAICSALLCAMCPANYLPIFPLGDAAQAKWPRLRHHCHRILVSLLAIIIVIAAPFEASALAHPIATARRRFAVFAPTRVTESVSALCPPPVHTSSAASSLRPRVSSETRPEDASAWPSHCYHDVSHASFTGRGLLV
ncbi:hypothetical protein FALBO_4486 [Fusarium albosuccineum]|uniref:Uncharacterized protein n=1 Tax=Fusarium albosuccineum TaxID=1237068 RepID=A0A8H4LI71_9HYPO|nr:hypothetical protein FALBO_4486 [Fusarium albosuccineum]